MTREQTKKALPILQAYAEGKTIQYKVGDNWKDITSEDWGYNPYCSYRIKPEKPYRPFKDAEECWQEMQKHKPFGWIKVGGQYKSIAYIRGNGFLLARENYVTPFEVGILHYQFADGTPFGMKIETKE